MARGRGESEGFGLTQSLRNRVRERSLKGVLGVVAGSSRSKQARTAYAVST